MTAAWTKPKPRIITDYIKAGEKLDRSWKGPYLQTGCPVTETGRGLGWLVGLRSPGLNDAVAYLWLACCCVAFLVAPWWAGIAAEGFWHGIWVGIQVQGICLGGMLVQVANGYWGVYWIGELLHGNPFASGGKLAKKAAKTKKEQG